MKKLNFILKVSKTKTNIHHMPKGIKNFRVIDVCTCETKIFDDSYEK
jgi:hypothetical protein